MSKLVKQSRLRTLGMSLLSYFKPVRVGRIIQSGNKDIYIEDDREVIEQHGVIWKPYAEAEYTFVGFVKDPQGKDRVLHRFYDPVTKRDFTLSKDMVDLLLYRK